MEPPEDYDEGPVPVFSEEQQVPNVSKIAASTDREFYAKVAQMILVKADEPLTSPPETMRNQTGTPSLPTATTESNATQSRGPTPPLSKDASPAAADKKDTTGEDEEEAVKPDWEDERGDTVEEAPINNEQADLSSNSFIVMAGCAMVTLMKSNDARPTAESKPTRKPQTRARAARSLVKRNS